MYSAMAPPLHPNACFRHLLQGLKLQQASDAFVDAFMTGKEYEAFVDVFITGKGCEAFVDGFIDGMECEAFADACINRKEYAFVDALSMPS